MKAKLSYTRIGPQKMRLVADLIRGKGVNPALSILRLTPKKGARILEKVIRSAVANAGQKHPVDPDVLFIKTLCIDGGPTMKRYLPRAQGRATPLRKRSCHVTLDLEVK